MSPLGVVCAKCGAGMPVGAQFCGSCGARIEEPPPAPARGKETRRPQAPGVRFLIIAWAMGLLGGFFLGRAFSPGTSGNSPSGEQATQAPEDSEHLLVQARAASDAKRYAQARNFYERALALSPDDHSAQVDLGIAFLALGDEKGARHAFEEALSGSAPHPAAAYNLARMAEKAGDSQGAAKYYALFLKLAPDGPRAAEVRAKIGSTAGSAAP